jgi:hypothetical protein
VRDGTWLNYVSPWNGNTGGPTWNSELEVADLEELGRDVL